MTKQLWLKYCLDDSINLMSGLHGEEHEEKVTQANLSKSMREIMKFARAGNYDHVYWEGLYEQSKRKPIMGHKTLVNLAVKLSENKKIKV